MRHLPYTHGPLEYLPLEAVRLLIELQAAQARRLYEEAHHPQLKRVA